MLQPVQTFMFSFWDQSVKCWNCSSISVSDAEVMHQVTKVHRFHFILLHFVFLLTIRYRQLVEQIIGRRNKRMRETQTPSNKIISALNRVRFKAVTFSPWKDYIEFMISWIRLVTNEVKRIILLYARLFYYAV